MGCAEDSSSSSSLFSFPLCVWKRDKTPHGRSKGRKGKKRRKEGKKERRKEGEDRGDLATTQQYRASERGVSSSLLFLSDDDVDAII